MAVATTPPCAYAQAPAARTPVAELRAAVLCLVNRERIRRGLPRLSEDRRLDRSAQGWTATMVRTGRFTHGSDFAARITTAGFRWSAAGENIATGYTTPSQVLAGWMASTGHCRNILDPSFSALGIGVVGAPVRGTARRGATWTQDFALPLGRRAPSGNRRPAAGCPY
jgi:uncharacterized protein YkwD